MDISSSDVVVGELLVLVVSSEGSGGEDDNGCGRSAVGVTRVVLLLLLHLSLLAYRMGGSESFNSRLLSPDSMRRGGVRFHAERPLLTSHLLEILLLLEDQFFVTVVSVH